MPDTNNVGTGASVRLANIDHVSGLLRPVWRGRLHAWAAALALPAGILLAASAPTTTAKVAAGVFAAALVGVYVISSAYHILVRTAARQRLFQRLDHAMIYVLIAGTSTPLCLLAAPGHLGIPALVVVWGGAVCGVVLALTWRAHRVASAMYLILGWAGIIAVPSAVARTGLLPVVLLAVGGLAYTAGAVLFFTGRPRLRPDVFGYHEMWHAFTILAGGAHFAAIAALLARVP